MKLLYLHTISTIDSEKANLVSVLSSCNAFVSNGLEVELILPKSDNFNHEIDKYIKDRFDIDLNFKIIFFNKKSNSKFHKYFMNNDIKKILYKSKADFVFTRIPNFINTILKTGKKVILESHNNSMHDKYPFIDLFWKKKVAKYSKHKNFKMFICISGNLKKYWKKNGILNSKLIALHDGFSSSQYVKHIDKNHARSKLKISIDKKIVMYVGSLYPDREIENILWLAKKHQQTLFYIVGGPNKLKDYYINLSKNMYLKNVVFTGHVHHKEIPYYLFSSDILLALWSKKVPTINYCSPLKIFEYMASGKIIIAHDFITIREVLQNNNNAFLVDPSNHEELSLTLDKALKERSNRLGIAAREKVFNQYTWDLRAKKIIDFINNA